MDNGVVQQDGRIDVGDMILQVNDVNFENLSNDEAVAVLRKSVSKLGPITLVVAKHCWLRSLKPFNKPFDEQSEEALNLKNQPVRPIDPTAWVEHTRQVNRNSKGNLVYFKTQFKLEAYANGFSRSRFRRQNCRNNR